METSYEIMSSGGGRLKSSAQEIGKGSYRIKEEGASPHM